MASDTANNANTSETLTDKLKAAEARADELSAQLKTANAEIKRLTNKYNELADDHLSLKRELSESFNSGDGAYRP